jgi:WD40 repeat protein
MFAKFDCSNRGSSATCSRWNPDNENHIAVSYRYGNGIQIFDLLRSTTNPFCVLSSDSGSRTSSLSTISSFVETFQYCRIGSGSFRNTVIAGSNSGSIRIWDIRSAQSSMELNKRKNIDLWKMIGRSDINESIRKILCTSDGNVVCAVHSDASVQLWDLRFSPAIMRVLQTYPQVHQGSRVASAAIMDDSILILQLEDGSLIRYDLVSDKLKVNLEVQEQTLSANRQFSVSPEDNQVYLGSADKIFMLDASKLQVESKTRVAMSANSLGSQLGLYSQEEDNRVCVVQCNPCLPNYGVVGLENDKILAYGLLDTESIQYDDIVHE